MLIRRKRGWELPEHAATDETAFWSRRDLAKAIAAGPILAAPMLGRLGVMPALAADEPDPSAGFYPAKRNDRYALDRPLTDAKYSTTYNNFYEFGTEKDVWRDAQALKVRPWTIKVDGMVEKPMTLGIDDLLKRVGLEERLYRHRCVEAWSMAIPWTGFAFARLVEFAAPLASARYVRMETFLDSKMASGQRQSWLPWPYIEGLTMAEATNELAFLAIGAYGKPMPKQHGFPLRLAVPWKYGFKSIKSIVRFTFTDQRPKGFWEALQQSEYGFWANVNPDVPHPRWSQATEELIGLGERRPTMMFNGYGEQVAALYRGLEKERLYA